MSPRILFLLCISAASAVSTNADDSRHPFHPNFHKAAHSSLAPASPRWFRPGFGYQLPYHAGFPASRNPYLSTIANVPTPYSHVWLIDSRRESRMGRPWVHSSRTGLPWYLPSDRFSTLDPRHEFGRLK